MENKRVLKTQICVTRPQCVKVIGPPPSFLFFNFLGFSSLMFAILNIHSRPSMQKFVSGFIYFIWHSLSYQSFLFLLSSYLSTSPTTADNTFLILYQLFSLVAPFSLFCCSFSVISFLITSFYILIIYVYS